MDEEYHASIQGRIIAIELLMRGLLAAHITQQSEPLVTLSTTRQSFFATLQNLERPIDSEADLIWEKAADALEETFRELEIRVRSIVAKRQDQLVGAGGVLAV
ncbi:hypothetical protein NKH10_23990 [Mesorhizobium sp. M1340]|uniref:hypothetical protein n=1 Tax=unclassified Mesorhizobium TaxID=325217 RepID=UPI00333C5695